MVLFSYTESHFTEVNEILLYQQSELNAKVFMGKTLINRYYNKNISG